MWLLGTSRAHRGSLSPGCVGCLSWEPGSETARGSRRPLAAIWRWEWGYRLGSGLCARRKSKRQTPSCLSRPASGLHFPEASGGIGPLLRSLARSSASGQGELQGERPKRWGLDQAAQVHPWVGEEQPEGAVWAGLKSLALKSSSDWGKGGTGFHVCDRDLM